MQDDFNIITTTYSLIYDFCYLVLARSSIKSVYSCKKLGKKAASIGGLSFPFLKERPGKLMTPVSAELEPIPELSSCGTPPHSHSYLHQEPLALEPPATTAQANSHDQRELC